MVDGWAWADVGHARIVAGGMAAHRPSAPGSAGSDVGARSGAAIGATVALPCRQQTVASAHVGDLPKSAAMASAGR